MSFLNTFVSSLTLTPLISLVPWLFQPPLRPPLGLSCQVSLHAALLFSRTTTFVRLAAQLGSREQRCVGHVALKRHGVQTFFHKRSKTLLSPPCLQGVLLKRVCHVLEILNVAARSKNGQNFYPCFFMMNQIKKTRKYSGWCIHCRHANKIHGPFHHTYKTLTKRNKTSKRRQ